MGAAASQFAMRAVDMALAEVMRMIQKGGHYIAQVKKTKAPLMSRVNDPVLMRSKGCGVRLKKQKYK